MVNSKKSSLVTIKGTKRKTGAPSVHCTKDNKSWQIRIRYLVKSVGAKFPSQRLQKVTMSGCRTREFANHLSELRCPWWLRQFPYFPNNRSWILKWLRWSTLIDFRDSGSYLLHGPFFISTSPSMEFGSLAEILNLELWRYLPTRMSTIPKSPGRALWEI